jgi:SAM-dependent methyltransferase
MTENAAAVELEEMRDEDRLGAALSSMSDDDAMNLLGSRYRPILVNLHSILHGTLPPDRVRELAVRLTKASVWSGRAAERYLRSLPGQEFQYRLDGWENGRVEALLRCGKGLLLCTFRYGLYGFLPLEIAARGIETVCPLAELQYRGTLEDLSQFRERLGSAHFANRENLAAVANISSLKLVPVDSPSAVAEVVRVTRRGGIALIYADGNNGLDGPWGNEGRTDVPFFGFQVSVKTGIAKLAWLLGCPILPVFAESREDHHGELRFREPVFPPDRNSARQDDFVSRCMTRLYGLLEEEVHRKPDQWEGVSALHRWRRAEVRRVSAPPVSVQVVLDEGGRLRINEPGGVVRTSGAFGEVLVDSKAMKGFRAPAQAGALFDALASQGGVDRVWIRQRRPESETTMAILAELWNRRLIIQS